MRSVLVTGVNGFTGAYLASNLTGAGYQVHGIVQRKHKKVLNVAQSYVCDLADKQHLKEIISSIRPQFIVHLAAISFVNHDNVEDIYQTNIVGTRNLLDAIAGTYRPDMVLLASSANIYGNKKEGMIDESVEPMPANDYGISKLAMEHVSSLYKEKFPITLVRPFNYTGVGQSPRFIIPKIVEHVRRREPVIELGNIDVARDFSDVRTVVDVYTRLLACPSAAGRTFNVCSGKAYTLSQVLDLTRMLSGHDFIVNVNPAFVRSNEVKWLCGNNSALQVIIGPLDIPPLEETIRWMLEA
jgi:nucleoside-diphosphate-sugar epimerase